MSTLSYLPRDEANMECKEYERNPNDMLIYDYLVIGFEDIRERLFLRTSINLKVVNMQFLI